MTSEGNSTHLPANVEGHPYVLIMNYNKSLTPLGNQLVNFVFLEQN